MTNQNSFIFQEMFFTILISLLTHQLVMASSSEEVTSRFLNLEKSCINLAVAKAPCQYTGKTRINGENYANFPIQNLMMKFYMLHDKASKVGKRVYRSFPLYDLIKPSYKVAKESYNAYVNKLIHFSNANHLNTEERAKLVLCSSSLMIKYKKFAYNDAKADHDPYLIAKRGIGMCRQFSTVAVDIGKALNIPIKRSFNPGHSFVSFKLNRHGQEDWYAAEPQNKSCYLMKQ